MASPFAKVGLEQIIYEFYRARIEHQPKQYERSDRFIDSYNKAYNQFRGMLYTVNLDTIKKKVSDDNISNMKKAYLKNAKSYSLFINKIRDNNEFFQQIPPNTILKSQMYFGLIMSGFYNEQWVISSKFTHIWPFCD